MSRSLAVADALLGFMSSKSRSRRGVSFSWPPGTIAPALLFIHKPLVESARLWRARSSPSGRIRLGPTTLHPRNPESTKASRPPHANEAGESGSRLRAARRKPQTDRVSLGHREKHGDEEPAGRDAEAGGCDASATRGQDEGSAVTTVATLSAVERMLRRTHDKDSICDRWNRFYRAQSR